MNENGLTAQHDENPLPLTQAEMARQLAPFMEMIRQLLETQRQMAENNRMISKRMEELEREIKYSVRITPEQTKKLTETAKQTAKRILSKYGLDENRGAVIRTTNAVKRDIIARMGVCALYEIPQSEFSIAVSQAENWFDLIKVKEIRKKASDKEQ